MIVACSCGEEFKTSEQWGAHYRKDMPREMEARRLHLAGHEASLKAYGGSTGEPAGARFQSPAEASQRDILKRLCEIETAQFACRQDIAILEVEKHRLMLGLTPTLIKPTPEWVHHDIAIPCVRCGRPTKWRHLHKAECHGACARERVKVGELTGDLAAEFLRIMEEE